MRGKGGVAGDSLRASKEIRHWLDLPAYYRYGLRNVMRHRGRTVATVGSMALALGVATAYRLSVNSIDGTLGSRFAGDRWQLLVDFLYPVYLEDLESLEKLPGVASVHPYLRRYVQVEKNGVYDDATLVGILDEEQIVDLQSPIRRITEGRRPSSSGRAEVVLSLGLARKLGAKLGDAVNVHALNEAHSVRVVGLSSDVVTALALVPFSFAQDVSQLSGKASGVYAVTDDPSPDLTDELYRIEFVGKIVPKSGLLEQIRKVLYVMFGVLNVCAAVSIFLAALFILTSINLSVLETESEFATLKAIGYGEKWITRIVLTEASVYAVGAMLLSVPVGAAISVYLNRRMGQAWFLVDDFFSPLEFATVLIPALLFVPLGAYPALRHVLRIPISDALSTRIIE
jgi:ABC-type lipoprotein release transport system permease subunit